MKKFGVIFGFAALVVLLALSLAEAKRMGGGGSFGSRSSYSRSYTPPASPSPGYSQPARQSAAPQTAPAAPLAAPQPGGMFSRLGWGMGGFLAGGLLGSMLFGHGGMGGFGGGIGLLDIVLLGVIIFLAVKLLRRRGSSPEASTWTGQAPPPPPSSPMDPHSRAEQSWEGLRSQPAAPGTAATGGFGAAPVTPEAEPQPVVPPGFNLPEFLEGAKTVYARLQHSWDRRDLADIALFTTPDVLDEIKRQAAADPTPSKTELLLINARLLEFREEPRDTVTSVYFDVLMREDAAEERPKQVREVWHFSRPTGSVEANWRLEGIQQMES